VKSVVSIRSEARLFQKERSGGETLRTIPQFAITMTLLERFLNTRLFVFDVDGVLTDGSLYVFADGEQVRKMNIKDGFALQLAVKKGYGLMVMSGGHSDGVKKRLEKLGISDVFMKVADKKELLLTYLAEKKISPDHVLFMGDDIPDYPVMKIAGLACAPANAMPEIKALAHYISTKNGGDGCAREVIEKVLKANGHWELETDVSSR
jgi:3-deoxy-D-manno-octulosonate 8-phosphate phosphatase (KDO 8-P phosphatase)